MPLTLPGGLNTFVPNWEASGKLAIDYARDPNKFAINRYAQIVPTQQMIGYYLFIDPNEAGRILNTNLSDIVWPDGNDAPTGTDQTMAFNFLAYRQTRYAPTFRIGNMAIEQADYDIVMRHAMAAAQKMMTGRTQLATSLLTNTGNWPASNTSPIFGGAITGNSGTWAQSTTARQDIKRSLNYAREVILNGTLAAVDVENELHLVISTSLAAALSQSQEIVDYIKSSPEALAMVRGELPGRNSFYGLPDKLYGVPLEVEKTRKVTSHKGATPVITSVFPTTSAALISRVGGLEGVAGTPSFSTLTEFVYSKNEMLVETMVDPNNKRTSGRIVHTDAYVLTSTASGFLFTGCQ